MLWLASLGGALELYDFIIFVFFAGAIGKVFFAASVPEWVRQLHTLGIFAAGYLARPLGGIVIAHFGDTLGRKRMFTLSVGLMAIPTFLIGLLPTYTSIGVAAPLLLLALRVLQGIAIGGEAPGGWVFVAEHARPGKLGFAVGLLTSGLSVGQLLGSFVATALSIAVGPAQIADGFWRVPFVIGGLFGFIAMRLRRWLEETPVFADIRRRHAIERGLPLGTVLARHRRAVLASVASTWTLTAAILVVMLLTPSFLQGQFGVPATIAQVANLDATAALCVSVLVMGAASDRFGARRVAALAFLVLAGATYGLYLAAAAMPSLVIPLYVLAGIGAGGAVFTPILMVRAFPPSVRFSGVSFSYNVSYALSGAATPLLLTWLSHLDRLSPAHYVAVAALVGLAAIWVAPVAEVDG